MYILTKEHKRLYIKDGDRILYSPPDFIRSFIRNRTDLNELLHSCTIQDIIAFETKIRPCGSAE